MKKYQDMTDEEKEDYRIVFFYNASLVFMIISAIIFTSFAKDTVFVIFVSGLLWFFLIQYFFINRYGKYFEPYPRPGRRWVSLRGRVKKSNNKQKDILKLIMLTLLPLTIIILLKFL